MFFITNYILSIKVAKFITISFYRLKMEMYFSCCCCFIIFMVSDRIMYEFMFETLKILHTFRYSALFVTWIHPWYSIDGHSIEFKVFKNLKNIYISRLVKEKNYNDEKKTYNFKRNYLTFIMHFHLFIADKTLLFYH